MPRQGRLDRDLRGLDVADLADHHDVGVRAEDRTQRRRERQPGARVDLHLVQAGQPILDRILDRDHVDLRPVDLGHRGEQGRRLARARGAGDEQRAGRPVDHRSEPLLHRRTEPDLFHRRRLLGLVEEAHDDRLALDRRQGRDADVEHPPRSGRGERDASVLRLPAFGDVELREHLQARGDADRAASGDPLGLVEHAVDAEADDERVRLRLEVDVARAVLGRLEDDRVDEPDERGVGDAVVDLEIVDLFLVDHLELGGFAQSRACAERLRCPREPPELVRDVFAPCDAQHDRVLAREA